MRMRRLFALCAVAVMLAACGGASATGTGPDTVTPAYATASNGAGGKLGARTVSVCDALDYSGPFYPASVTGNTVALMWQEAPCAARGYAVEVYRRGAGDVYALAAATVVPQHVAEVFLSNGGSYYARVRALGRGDSMGPWTDPAIYFSVNEEDNTPVAPVVVITPGGGDGGDGDDDGGLDTGGGNGHEGEGNNGNGGDNGGGNGNGNGGGNPPPPPPPPASCGAGFHKSPIVGTHPPVFECAPDGDPSTGDSQSGNGGHGHNH